MSATMPRSVRKFSGISCISGMPPIIKLAIVQRLAIRLNILGDLYRHTFANRTRKRTEICSKIKKIEILQGRKFRNAGNLQNIHNAFKKTAFSMILLRNTAASGCEIFDSGCNIPFMIEESKVQAYRKYLLTSAGFATLFTVTSTRAADGAGTGLDTAWTNGANWSSSPSMSGGTATFINNDAPTPVNVPGNVMPGTTRLDAGAPAYPFTSHSGTFTLTGNGIGINSNAPAFGSQA